MCDEVESIATKQGVERAAELAVYLVAATTRVEDVRHADFIKDYLRRTIVEQTGG